MAKVPNGVETLPKISVPWVGHRNVTDDRQMDGWQHIANVNVNSPSLNKKCQRIVHVQGAFRKFVAWHSLLPDTHIISLFNRHLQPKCTWSSISPKLWFCCRRIVVLAWPASHLLCNTNTNGKYGGWQSSSKPAFWLAASAWADMWAGSLSWLQVTSLCFLNWKNSWKNKFFDDEVVICTANGWLKDQEQLIFYNGNKTLEKRWTKCISVAGEYVEKRQNVRLVVNCVRLCPFERPSFISVWDVVLT